MCEGKGREGMRGVPREIQQGEREGGKWMKTKRGDEQNDVGDVRRIERTRGHASPNQSLLYNLSVSSWSSLPFSPGLKSRVIFDVVVRLHNSRPPSHVVYGRS